MIPIPLPIQHLVSKLVNLRARFEVQSGGRVCVGRDVEGLHLVSFGGNNAVGRGTVFAGDVSVGFGSTIGANCYFNGPLSIGNYSQIGPAVGIYGRDHPVSFAATYVNRTLFGGSLGEHACVKPAAVGHDVWIGHGAVILKGVHIGTGAIIGAGTVVTVDVPEYAIVAGNPARILRTRFSSRVVNLLLQLEWWQMKPDELKNMERLFHIDFDRDEEAGLALLYEALELRKNGPMVLAPL